MWECCFKVGSAGACVVQATFSEAQQCLNFPQSGLQLDRRSQMGDRSGGVSTEEEQHSEISLSIDIVRIKHNDGLKLRNSQIRPLLC